MGLMLISLVLTSVLGIPKLVRSEAIWLDFKQKLVQQKWHKFSGSRWRNHISGRATQRTKNKGGNELCAQENQLGYIGKTAYMNNFYLYSSHPNKRGNTIYTILKYPLLGTFPKHCIWVNISLHSTLWTPLLNPKVVKDGTTIVHES